MVVGTLPQQILEQKGGAERKGTLYPHGLFILALFVSFVDRVSCKGLPRLDLCRDTAMLFARREARKG